MIALYGATGFTGRLVARALAARRLPLLLVGRCSRRYDCHAAPRPTQVAADAVPRTRACNLDTVVGRVRVHRWAWQRKGSPTVRPLDEARGRRC